MRRLFCVPDVELDVVSPLEREKILFRCRDRFRFWSSNCSWHNDLLTLSRSARLSKYKIDNHTSQGCARWIDRSVGRCYDLAAKPRLANNAHGTARSTLFRIFRRGRGDEFLEARIVPKRIEHWIEPEQRRSERVPAVVRGSIRFHRRNLRIVKTFWASAPGDDNVPLVKC